MKPLLLLSVSIVLAGLTACNSPPPEQQIDDGVRLLEQGRVEAAQRKLNGAIAQLEASVKAHPDDARLLHLLGKAYFWAGRDDVAGVALDRAATLEPDNAEYRYMLGLYHKNTDHPGRAVAEFARATELAPDNADYWYQLGATHAMMNVDDQAIDALKHALSLDANHAQAMFTLGLVYDARGDTDAALAMFEQAAEADPTLEQAHYNAAVILQQSGRHTQALQHLNAAAELDPDDWRTVERLVQVHQALANADQRDRHRARLIAEHKAGRINDEAFCRERFKIGDATVMAFEHFELTGARPTVFAFFALDPKTGLPTSKIIVGSFDELTRFAREAGDIGPRQRLYHLDRYNPDGTYTTFATYKRRPSYETARDQAVAIIEGRLTPPKKKQ